MKSRQDQDSAQDQASGQGELMLQSRETGKTSGRRNQQNLQPDWPLGIEEALATGFQPAQGGWDRAHTFSRKDAPWALSYAGHTHSEPNLTTLVWGTVIGLPSCCHHGDETPLH